MIRRMLSCAVAALVALGLFIQMIPYGHDHPNPPVKSEPAWPSLPVRALAVRACFDCHSNQTVWPWYSYIAPVSWGIYGNVTEGRQSLNFSEWNRTEWQAAAEFKEVYQEKNMPPATYLLMHPAAELSDAEWKQLFDGLGSIAAHYQSPSSP